MFTGIITDIGRIEAVEQRGDTRLKIACGYDMASVDLGASIACSGVCLTVVDKGEGWFAIDASAETLSRTAPDMWGEGRRLNLERALKVGDELGGHIVTGHVDGIGIVEELFDEGASTRVRFEASAELAPYIAEKGSITIDGVSLTVNSVADAPGARYLAERETPGTVIFDVNLIPHTSSHTTLGDLHQGQAVNIEIDILARYLGRMDQLRSLMERLRNGH